MGLVASTMGSKEIDKYWVGGYVTLGEGDVKCWFGELIIVKEQGDEYIEGLGIGLQFMLEEVNAIEEDITAVVDTKDIVGWINEAENKIQSKKTMANKSSKDGRSVEALGILSTMSNGCCYTNMVLI
ncbi:hypothetical protein PIB30_075442 [Stylosanthes scabra]|uniref:Uncharacterized protein n=1 Tax=Stylosanthes scabra TaxID=79078 RepID=A0ABU6VSJ8_9FABA|nr:hypothetical protein [Stylosanthes scabra]